jgi:hypothetical protein
MSLDTASLAALADAICDADPPSFDKCSINVFAPSEREIAANARSRSAHVRYAAVVLVALVNGCISTDTLTLAWCGYRCATRTSAPSVGTQWLHEMPASASSARHSSSYRNLPASPRARLLVNNTGQ